MCELCRKLNDPQEPEKVIQDLVPYFPYIEKFYPILNIFEFYFLGRVVAQGPVPDRGTAVGNALKRQTAKKTGYKQRKKSEVFFKK